MSDFPIEVPDLGYFERLISCREGCPVRTDASGYVQAVARGDYERAYRIARGPNPFASICGRVCGAPCEVACRRGIIDEPVHIRAIKRTACERFGVEVAEDLRTTLEMSTSPGSLDPEPRSEKVAVVGAGVAGMSCAHDLARLGFSVTVFEADPKPGGMLVYGVPKFRLPARLVQNEIDAILELGVKLECGVRIGTDVTIAELRERGFEAVFIGAGLQSSRMLEIPGHENEGIVPGLSLLRRFNDGEEIEAMGRVIIIGGGDVAYDCARCSVRLPGTESVTLVCLEALHEMPASESEIVEGEEEGIVRVNRRGPVRFLGEDGKITGLEVREVSRVFDEEGRFAPEMIPGTESTISGDTIVMAIGQAGDTGFATGVKEIEIGRGGTVIADAETGRTSLPWLFAGGDIALGPRLFIDAVAHGRRAALAIHEYLVGEPVPEGDPSRSFAFETNREDLEHDYLSMTRKTPPSTDAEERVRSTEMEVEVMFPDPQAREQGLRCLRCEVETVFDGSLCIMCGGCADVCPTYCLRLVTLDEIGMTGPEHEGMTAIVKDEDRCIRCAQCAVRCPTDTITMERLCGHEPWHVVAP
jgi:NADPH-dependent glutamate synthase beta subunit-like oxidoreductase/ferredoxin